MNKPAWLRKRFSWRPWKYPHETREGTITVYNFGFNPRRTPLEDQNAVDWINRHGEECDSSPGGEVAA